ncbi:uncharacterized protein EV420DRAFT_1770805 [Desarmillaria tabescens]|uniref:Uncharacterized protein n=1 Tax=Armillaria tabescens TaxID=1929756 RepID=A0AA39J2M5_ARMTA|nr:uncharacterized protein EV420DRAFT_1770805 [Desarmillaria tabescens]KAK0434992.1 hypothetical protein EV420DRAFT_1770805 [Desarmillaria tabescens]
MSSLPRRKSDNLNRRRRTKRTMRIVARMTRMTRNVRPYRFYPRAIHLWVDAEDIIMAGIEHAAKAIKAGIKPHELPYKTANEKAFSILCELWEREMTFEEAFSRFETRQEGVQVVIREIQLDAGEGRASDTNKVWTKILDLMLEDRQYDTITKPVPGSKGEQGFNHVDTGRLLVLMDMAEGGVKVTASDWPSFLYCQEEHVKNNPESGLMKGCLLLRVFLHIFVGNGDPNKQGGPKQQGIAKINGMHKVTGHHLAYAACQARYALSSKDTWSISDGAVRMDVFYDAIVDLFEKHPEDEWTVDTLKWWNEQVFGDPEGCPEDVDDRTNVHPPESSVQAVSDARDARAKARAEAAAALAKVENAQAAGDKPTDLETELVAT